MMSACTGEAGDRTAPGTDGAQADTASLAELPRRDPGAADRAAWHARLGWAAECEDAFAATSAAGDAGLAFHEISPGVSLVEVRCASGSYQPSWIFLRLDERVTPPVIEALTFPTAESPDGETIERTESMELWGLPTFLPEAVALTLLSYSRQTRDCGIWSRYALTEAEPRLEELFARLPCPAEPEAAADPVSGRPPEGWTRVPVN